MRLHRMEGYEELKCTSYTETMRVMLCYSESTFVVGVILRVLTYTDASRRHICCIEEVRATAIEIRFRNRVIVLWLSGSFEILCKLQRFRILTF